VFKEYQSKPITRKAYQIKPEDVVILEEGEYYLPEKGITFVAHEKVKVGDWIIYLNEHHIYQCSDQVFRERNIVE
jgi:hypothetical protein